MSKVEELKLHHWYFYRFHAGGESSPVGRTRTAPVIDAMPDRLRFAFTSWQHYESGYFNGYRWRLYDGSDLVSGGFITVTEGIGPHFDEGMVAIDCSGKEATGARVVTVTITDGVDPLEGCTVRLTEGVLSTVAVSDPQGVAELSVNDVTFVLSTTKPGYSGSVTALVVDGDESVNIELAAIILATPDVPGTATGIMTLTQHGVVASGIEVTAQLIGGTSTAGTGQVNPVWTKTSDQDGLVMFPGLAWGSRYQFWIGCRTDQAVELVIDPVTQVNLPNLIGD